MKRSNTSKILNEWKNFLNENEEYYVDNPKSVWDSKPHDVAVLIERLFSAMALEDMGIPRKETMILEEVFGMLTEQQLESLLDKHFPDDQQRDDMPLENDPDMGA